MFNIAIIVFYFYNNHDIHKMNGCLFMQTLKDEVKNKILEAALNEFEQYGYLNSSMRRISASAGITTGNIYRYFKNKDDLFRALLHPTYEKFLEYTLSIKEEIDKCYKKEPDEMFQIIRLVDETIVNLLKDYHVEIKILLTLSEGSDYEQASPQLITIVEQILEQVFSTSKGSTSLTTFDQLTINMYATMMIEGIRIILRDHEDGDTIKYLVDELIYVYSVGITEKLKC